VNAYGGGREYRAARRHVMMRRFLVRRVFASAVIILILVVINVLTGGPWWSLWVAAIWGGLLLLRVGTTLVFWQGWNRDREEQLIQNELRRRHR
jgi:putative flippase GtrA